MTASFGLKGVFAVALASALGMATACSSSGDSPKGGGGSGGSGATPLPTDSGYCEPVCPKDCTVDNDCQTSSGELCCDIGVGKICASAQQCPRSCTDDTKCSTSSGEACLQTSLVNTQKICTSPAAAIQTCQSDSQCKTGDICCGNYSQSVCLPPNQCPQSCALSSECNTGSGEICCTTVGKLDASLKVSGLCLNPMFDPCPQTCTQSSDCSGNTDAPLCCDGVCSKTCAKQCKMSSDCNDPNARLCCKSAVVRLPAEGHVFTTGPTCVGTPVYTTCGQCSGSACCSGIPGCSSASATGVCSGTAYPCSNNFTSSECAMTPGCTWDGTFCTGTPDSCSTLTTSATCENDFGCYWSSGLSTCSGTPTYKACKGLSPSTCSTVLGCQLSLPTPEN